MVTVAFILFAVTKQAPSTVPKLTLVYWGVIDSEDAMRPFLAAYKTSRPNVTVEYVQKDFANYRNDLLDALASGSGPDLFQIPATWVPEYAAKGRVTPLPASYSLPDFVQKKQLFKTVTSVVQRAQNPVTVAELARDFVPSVSEDSIVNGAIVALPFAADSLALFSNRELLNNARITAPPTSWEELKDASPKLTIADASGNLLQSAIALGAATNVPHAAEILTGLMVQGGATLVDPGTKTAAFNQPTEPDYNPGVAATELFASFATPGKETYTWSAKQGDAFSAFTGGTVALYLGYQFELPRIREAAPQLAFDVTPMLHLDPSGTDRYGCTVGGVCRTYNVAGNWETTVAKLSKHPLEAWDFIQFMARNPSVQRSYAQATKRTPVLRSALDAAKTGGVEDVWINQAFTAHTWYHGLDAITAERAITDVITAVAEGTSQPLEALNLAAQQISATLR
jgi:ABC-type glycerol-3-phosphate transport system substrate-binding protein